MDLKKKIKGFFTLTRKANGGFTLVELIVVIAILAILAGVAVPAYNGYIKKADRSADEALLNEINTAFASACMANGESNFNRSLSTTKLVIKDGTLIADNALDTENDNIDASFEKFFEGEKAFKGETSLRYDAEFGGFSRMADTYTTILNVLLNGDYDDEILAYQESGFAAIGYDVLAGNIDAAAGLISGIASNGDADSNFTALLESDAVNNALLGYLGGDPEKALDLLEDMTDKKAAELMAKDPTLTKVQADTLAMNQIRANAAVLNAASNTSAVDTTFKTAMANGTAKDTIVANLKSTDPTKNEAAVAQAAYAYGMYASYMQYSGKTMPNEVNLMDVYNVLSSNEFSQYMQDDQAQKDMAGYEGSMSLIVASANNADTNTVSDILLNGFSNDDLLGLMQNVTSKSK